MKILLIFLNVLFFSWRVCALDMYAFNSGQGNFFLLKTKNRVMVVDCGGTRSGEHLQQPYSSDYEPTGSKGQEVIKILDDVISCDVIYTHNHADHYDIFPKLTSIIEAINNRRRLSRREPIAVTECLAVEFTTKKDSIPFLRRDETRIECRHWFPLYSDGELGFFNDEHDFNLILRLSYAGRNILFTGDASARLFSKLREESQRSDLEKVLLENIDCFIMPHHGSNRSGEYVWFHTAKESNLPDSHPAMLTIISSNPMESDNLPWISIQKLDCRRVETGFFTGEHVNSTCSATRTMISDAEYRIDKAIARCATTQPVFVTCDSAIYFKLMIDSTGVVSMYNDLYPEKPVFVMPYEEQE